MYSQKSLEKENTLEVSIEKFLMQVEKKAYRMAEIATRSQSDALDIVQDSMFKLVEKYSHKPADEWKPLFYRILHSRIMDYFRRQKLYKGIFFWKKSGNLDEHDEDEISRASDYITPEREVAAREEIENVRHALKQLSPRQQQCFLLRNWEGLSVVETAKAMKCSQGSVKTHYSRAKDALRKALNYEEI
jgi:RNA polymerase sigma-70 factor, ECF subfamily